MQKVSSFLRPAERIAAIKPYFFVSLNQKIGALRAHGVDNIRLDVGSPDLPPAGYIIEALAQAAQRPDVHGYAPDGGGPRFRQAAAAYYRRRFGVELDAQRETLGLIGSKEGVFILSQALLNPGDLALVTDPGYPIYRGGAQIAGAEIYSLPLLAQNGFLPDLEAISPQVARRAKLLWLNYPNNPTGAVASLEFFERAVAFARRYELLIAHDAPYMDICYDGYRAPSLLQAAGAKEVAVELNSLSKTYNMAGWRVGMVVGNAEAIKALTTLKTNIDSGIFRPLQDAAQVALTGDQSWLAERNMIYQRRRDIILGFLPKLGMSAIPPKGALYVWAKAPAGVDAEAFAVDVLERAGVWMTPGTAFGPHGAGYFRLSVCVPEERLREAGERLSKL